MTSSGQRRVAEYEQAQLRRRELTTLLSTRRTEARGKGASLGDKTGGADRRATHALQTKVRQAERLLERNELPERPFEAWRLDLSFGEGARPSDLVLRLSGAVVERGAFRLGPLDLDLAPGERLSIAGANGTGKSTLLRTLLDGNRARGGSARGGPAHGRRCDRPGTRGVLGPGVRSWTS